MFIAADIVARPLCRILLNPRIGCSGKHKGTLSVQTASRTFISGACHQQTVSILHIIECLLVFTLAKLNQVWKLSAPSGGFVHIIPKTLHAIVYIGLLELIAPPLPCFFFGEIGKMTTAGPHMPNVRSSTGILCKMIASQSVLIRLITFLYLNARVYDGHHIKTHPLHLPQHPLYIGILATPGEHFIVVHVVNVTHNNIGRQLLFPEGIGDGQQLFLIVIPPSGLLKTQAP